MKKALYISMVMMLAGCYSSIKVKVDTFDRYYLENSLEYKEAKAQKLRSTLVYLIESGFMETLLSDLKSKTSEVLTQWEDKQIIDSVYHSKIKANVMDKTTAVAKSVKGELIQALNKLNSGNESFLVAEEMYLKAVSGFNDFLGTLEVEFASVPNSDIEPIKVINDTKKSFNKYLSTYGESIVDDPLASLVTKSPNKYWKKEKVGFNMTTEGGQAKDAAKVRKSCKNARFNKTVARTIFGNSDIAIKMESPGNFVVKGVRLDADEAIKATFKTLNQGIKYFALSSGIAVKSKDGKADVAPELTKLNTLELDYKTITAESDAALRVFKRILMDQKRILESDADDREKELAVQNIKDAYQVLKKSLTI